MNKYSIEQIKLFLKDWGTAFKQLDYAEHTEAEAYYQACCDAYLNLEGKALKFYNIAGLKRTLRLIADDFEAQFKSRRGGADYKDRAELMRHIADTLIKSPQGTAVQKQLFQQ